MGLLKTVQFPFFFCVFQPPFMDGSDEKTLYIFAKNNQSVSQVFQNVYSPLMFYSVFHNSCVPNDNNEAYWCICLLVALLEMCLWLMKTRMKLEVFETHTSLRHGAQRFFRYKWRKVDTPFSYFIVMEKIFAFLIEFSFFHLWVKI